MKRKRRRQARVYFDPGHGGAVVSEAFKAEGMKPSRQRKTQKVGDDIHKAGARSRKCPLVTEDTGEDEDAKRMTPEPGLKLVRLKGGTNALAMPWREIVAKRAARHVREQEDEVGTNSGYHMHISRDGRRRDYGSGGRERLEAYDNEMDQRNFAAWADEGVRRTNSLEDVLTVRAAWASYETWCRKRGEVPMKDGPFRRRLGGLMTGVQKCEVGPRRGRQHGDKGYKMHRTIPIR